MELSWVCVLLYIIVCMYVCMCVCMHACMYVCMHLCLYVMYVCMHACMFIQAAQRLFPEVRRVKKKTYFCDHCHVWRVDGARFWKCIDQARAKLMAEHAEHHQEHCQFILFAIRGEFHAAEAAC